MTDKLEGNATPGRVMLICGCMFSGKSERLVSAIQAAYAAGRQVAAFKHALDNRYAAGHIVTHHGQRVDAIAVSDVNRLLQAVGQADLVVIDEAQFFGDELVAACRSLADAGCEVIVAGLDLDSWGLPFGPMPKLEAMAEEIMRTSAICAQCGRPANRTQRLTPVTNKIMIGGPENYEPRCEACFVPPPAELRR
jgi:thymidine kinase